MGHVNYKLLYNQELQCELGLVVHSYNPWIGEAEAGGLRVWGQSELQSKTLSLKKKKAQCVGGGGALKKQRVQQKHNQSTLSILGWEQMVWISEVGGWGLETSESDILGTSLFWALVINWGK
jgi:hypothetical protein